jgi:hypothetical protein
VRQTNSFNEILVDVIYLTKNFACVHQESANRTAYLRHFNRMGEPSSVKVVLTGTKYLSFRLQASKGVAMSDSVSINLERGSIQWGVARHPRLAVKVAVESVHTHAFGY